MGRHRSLLLLVSLVFVLFLVVTPSVSADVAVPNFFPDKIKYVPCPLDYPDYESDGSAHSADLNSPIKIGLYTGLAGPSYMYSQRPSGYPWVHIYNLIHDSLTTMASVSDYNKVQYMENIFAGGSSYAYERRDTYYKPEGGYKYTGHTATYHIPSHLLGGVEYNSDCNNFFKAGTYIYGDLRSISLNLDVDGRTGWTLFHGNMYSPIGYGGGQLFSLDYAGVNYPRYMGLYTMMANPLDTALITWYYDDQYARYLLDDPNSGSLYVRYGRKEDDPKQSVSSKSYYGSGVYFLALAGGHESRNGQEYDGYELVVDIQGDVLITPDLITTADELRAKITPAWMDRSPSMCNLVGSHIKDFGMDGQTGAPVCCGARPATDLNALNYQYVCKQDPTTYPGGANMVKYRWENLCSKDASSLTEPEKLAKADNCCTSWIDGRCVDADSEGLRLTCTGAYTCWDQTDLAVCSQLPGCEAKPQVSITCDASSSCSSGQIFVKSTGFSYFAPEYYYGCMDESEAWDLGCYSGSCSYGLYSVCTLDYTHGTCQQNGSVAGCAAVSDQSCNSVIGCSLLGVDGGYYEYGTTCADIWNVNTCRDIGSVGGCTWSCRAKAGEECLDNAACVYGLQCDPDFHYYDPAIDPLTGNPASFDNETKRCHSTYNSCVVGPYQKSDGSYYSASDERASAGYTCADGVYKRCDVVKVPYNEAVCTQPAYPSGEFSCSGSPKTQECRGAFSCNGNNITDCGKYPGCVWDLPDCEGHYTNYYTGIVASCNGISQSECGFGDYATCFWRDSAYCSGTATWPPYCPAQSTGATGTCITTSGCYLYPPASATCSSVGDLATCTNYGCTGNCLLPSYGSAVDPETNSNACECAGRTWATCYIDNDQDGYVRDFSTSPIYRCIATGTTDIPLTRVVGATNYSCANSEPADCLDSDSQVYPGAKEICDNENSDCDFEKDAEGNYDAVTTPVDVGCDMDNDFFVSIGMICEGSFRSADGTVSSCVDRLGDCDDDPAVHLQGTYTIPASPCASGSVCAKNINPDSHPAFLDNTMTCKIDTDCDDATIDCPVNSFCNNTYQCQPGTPCWPDADGDGFGDKSAAGIVVPQPATCSAGDVSNNLDCDDNPAAHTYAGISVLASPCVSPAICGATINPGMNENGNPALCNSVSDDCDLLVDEGVGSNCYAVPQCTGSVQCSTYAAASCPFSAGCELSAGTCSVTGRMCFDNTFCLGGPDTCQGLLCSGTPSCNRLLTANDCGVVSGCTWSTCDDYSDRGWCGSMTASQGCSFACGGAPAYEVCSDRFDNNPLTNTAIDCADPGCNGGGTLSLTDAQVARYNCLGTNQTGEKQYAPGSYYCGEGKDAAGAVVPGIGLCCQIGKYPRKSIAGLWTCVDTTPCLAPTGECDFTYGVDLLSSWISDIGCFDPSAPSACCQAVVFGDLAYYSDAGNVKIYPTP